MYRRERACVLSQWWRESLTGWLLSGLSALANNALGIAYIVVVAHRLSLSLCLSVTTHTHDGSSIAKHKHGKETGGNRAWDLWDHL